MKYLVLAFLFLLCFPVLCSSQSDSTYFSRLTKIKYYETKQFTVKSFIDYMMLIGVSFPEIALRQSIEETSWFKAKNFRLGNNLFGLRTRRGYLKFNHWTQSVKAYRRLQQKHLSKTTKTYTCGYKFVKDMKYARNKRYVKNLRRINLSRLKINHDSLLLQRNNGSEFQL